MIRPFIVSMLIVAALDHPATLASEVAAAPEVGGSVSRARFGPKAMADAVAAEMTRPATTLRRDAANRPSRQASPPARSWARRHPVLLGALVGFGVGFGIGFAGGDDGVFDDFTGSASGVMLGGIGAGVGATIGALVNVK
jgi:hypothetical protein